MNWRTIWVFLFIASVDTAKRVDDRSNHLYVVVNVLCYKSTMGSHVNDEGGTGVQLYRNYHGKEHQVAYCRRDQRSAMTAGVMKPNKGAHQTIEVSSDGDICCSKLNYTFIGRRNDRNSRGQYQCLPLGQTERTRFPKQRLQTIVSVYHVVLDVECRDRDFGKGVPDFAERLHYAKIYLHRNDKTIAVYHQGYISRERNVTEKTIENLESERLYTIVLGDAAETSNEAWMLYTFDGLDPRNISSFTCSIFAILYDDATRHSQSMEATYNARGDVSIALWKCGKSGNCTKF